MVTRRSFVRQLGTLTLTGPVLTEAALARQTHLARNDALPASGMVWLGSNENPAGPPPAAIDAMRRGVGDVGRYHFEELDGFVEAIAASEGVAQQQVISAPGSGDVIRTALCAFASDTKPMITASPSYDIVVKLAKRLGKRVIEIPLTPQWTYPVRELAAQAQKSGGGLIYLVNPNNPTASLTPTEDIDWLATHLPADTVLLVDEAYLEFAEPALVESAIKHVRAGRNVVVSRTFSKIYGMAGARAGFGCAREPLILAMSDYMDNVIPVLALRGAAAALGEKATLVPKRRESNARSRAGLCQWLRQQGIPFIEPHANFVMIDTGRNVKPLGEAMLRKGVAVGRPFPPLDHMLRVTIGTDAQMQRFRSVFEEALRA